MALLIFFPIIGTLFFLFSSIVGSIIFDKVFFDNKKSFFLNNIVSSFIGISLIISVFSFIYSCFISVNIFIIILISFIYWLNRRKESFKLKLDLKSIIKNSCLFFVVFFLCLVLSIVCDYTKILNLDFLFYAGVVTDGIQETGIENVYGYFNNYISGEVDKPVPYHYFEFWMTVFFKKITFGYTSVIILKYLVYVFFKTFIIVAIFNLLKYFNSKTSYWFVLIILLSSFIPIDQFFNLFTNGWDIHTSFWERPNFLTYVFVIVSTIPFLLMKQYLNFCIITLFLPVMSITTAPVIFTTCFVFFIFLLWQKRIQFKEFFIGISITVLLFVFIVGFYYLLGERSISVLKTEFSILDYYKGAWKAMIYYIVTLALITVSPLITLGFICYKHKHNFPFLDLIIYAVISIASGVCIFQLLFFIDNSYQFVFVGYTFLYTIVLLMILMSMITLRNKLKYILYIFPVLGLLNIVYSFDQVYSTDLRVNNFYHREKVLLGENASMKLSRGGKILYVMEEEMKGVLPKKRHLLTNLPLSSLYYFADYDIIPVIDSVDLYNSLGIDSMETFKKAHSFNDRLPDKWTLQNINNLVLENDISIVAFNKNNLSIREKISHPVIDSLIISNYSLLFLDSKNN